MQNPDLNLRGQVRDIALINGQKKTRFLFLMNDEYPVFMNWKA